MKRLKNLGTRLSKSGRLVSWAKYLCPFCLEEIERPIGNGERDKSCGCVKQKENKTNFKHGQSKTKLYYIWGDMKRRCLNPNDLFYKDYGGRDITICNEWLEFIPFRDWALNNGYEEGLQINRINNNGNYEPFNCNWILSAKNAQNRRTTILTLEIVNRIRELHNTGNYMQKELIEHFKIRPSHFWQIINNKIWKI